MYQQQLTLVCIFLLILPFINNLLILFIHLNDKEELKNTLILQKFSYPLIGSRD
jgi:hypothetical protein